MTYFIHLGTTTTVTPFKVKLHPIYKDPNDLLYINTSGFTEHISDRTRGRSDSTDRCTLDQRFNAPRLLDDGSSLLF
jgi:hypothetical protein